MNRTIPSSGVRIVRPSECRWCRKQAEFDSVPIVGECPDCGAMQDPILRLGGLQRSFRVYHNPDDSIYIEVERVGESSRYILKPEILAERGLYLKTAAPLEGKRYGE